MPKPIHLKLDAFKYINEPIAPQNKFLHKFSPFASEISYNIKCESNVKLFIFNQENYDNYENGKSFNPLLSLFMNDTSYKMENKDKQRLYLVIFNDSQKPTRCNVTASDDFDPLETLSEFFSHHLQS